MNSKSSLHPTGTSLESERSMRRGQRAAPGSDRQAGVKGRRHWRCSIRIKGGAALKGMWRHSTSVEFPVDGALCSGLWPYFNHHADEAFSASVHRLHSPCDIRYKNIGGDVCGGILHDDKTVSSMIDEILYSSNVSKYYDGMVR